MVDEYLAGQQERELEEVAEAVQAPIGRRLAAEFFGTLLFVAVGTGAATVLAMGPVQRLGELLQIEGFSQGDNPRVFGALLGAGTATISELLPVALAFAAILATLVYALGGVSGAHFNPAVTFALAVGRRFQWKEVPLYWVVQCLGGIAGAFIVSGIYGDAGAKIEDVDILYGATRVASNVEFWQALLAEAFIAFILVTAIMAVAIDPRAPKGWSGWIIGLALASGIIVTAQATGGSANFARSLGPFVASLPRDVGNIPWGDLAVYALGPLIGASAAVLIYETVTGLELISPAPSPGAATPAVDAVIVADVDEEVDDTTTPPTTGTTT
jgi:glycerol uptake facilitator protein